MIVDRVGPRLIAQHVVCDLEQRPRRGVGPGRWRPTAAPSHREGLRGEFERLTGSGPLGTAVSTRTLAGSPPAAGTIVEEGFTLGLAQDGQMFRGLSGQVGEGLTGVTFVLAGGGTVQASVAGGWFAAWWPGHWAGGQAVLNGSQPSNAAIASVGASAVSSVRITTAGGSTTQPLNMSIQPTAGIHIPSGPRS